MFEFKFVLPVISKHRPPSPGSAFIAPWRHSKGYSQIAQGQIPEPSVASCVSLDKLLNLSGYQFPYLYGMSELMCLKYLEYNMHVVQLLKSPFAIVYALGPHLSGLWLTGHYAMKVRFVPWYLMIRFWYIKHFFFLKSQRPKSYNQKPGF